MKYTLEDLQYFLRTRFDKANYKLNVYYSATDEVAALNDLVRTANFVKQEYIKIKNEETKKS